MKKFKNHQRPRREYRFEIVDHKKALKIWRDSPFNARNQERHDRQVYEPTSLSTVQPAAINSTSQLYPTMALLLSVIHWTYQICQSH
jgi:hypothetical protein